MRQSDKALAETPAAPRALLLPEAADQTPASQLQDPQPASNDARTSTPSAAVQSRPGSPVHLSPGTLGPASLQPPAALDVDADAPGCMVPHSSPGPSAHTCICTDLPGNLAPSQPPADDGRLEREPCQDAPTISVQPQSQLSAPHAAAAEPRQQDTSRDQHDAVPNAAAEHAQQSGETPSSNKAPVGPRHPCRVSAGWTIV